MRRGLPVLPRNSCRFRGQPSGARLWGSRSPSHGAAPITPQAPRSRAGRAGGAKTNLRKTQATFEGGALQSGQGPPAGPGRRVPGGQDAPGGEEEEATAAAHSTGGAAGGAAGAGRTALPHLAQRPAGSPWLRVSSRVATSGSSAWSACGVGSVSGGLLPSPGGDRAPPRMSATRPRGSGPAGRAGPGGRQAGSGMGWGRGRGAKKRSPRDLGGRAVPSPASLPWAAGGVWAGKKPGP